MGTICRSGIHEGDDSLEERLDTGRSLGRGNGRGESDNTLWRNVFNLDSIRVHDFLPRGYGLFDRALPARHRRGGCPNSAPAVPERAAWAEGTATDCGAEPLRGQTKNTF